MKKTYITPKVSIFDLGLTAQPLCTSMEHGKSGIEETNEVLSNEYSSDMWSWISNGDADSEVKND